MTYNQTIQKILDEIKEDHWVEGYKATDEEAMGILLAGFFSWRGLPILKSAYFGLEDSNFHTTNETIDKLIKEMEAK